MYLTHNVVLISGLHQSESVIHTHVPFSKFFSHLDYSDQIRSVAQSCPTLCDPMNPSTPGFPVHHQLLQFTQTHLHRVSDAIQPSSPPSPKSSHPLPLPQIQKDSSIHLCLFCCLAYRVIVTIFLNFIYIYIYMC